MFCAAQVRRFRLAESSAVWIGFRFAENFPVGAWVGASFLADCDFLLEVLLVHATGLVSSFSCLSDWMEVAASTSSAAKAFAVCMVVWGCASSRAGCLVWLLSTSCDLLRREPFFAPFCRFGPLTAFLGCGGLYSFLVLAVVQSLWRCPSPQHFQQGPVLFGLGALAFWVCLRFATSEGSWRSA